MKLDNITLNYEYRYAELCDRLGESPARGQSQVLQYERWSKYFEWHAVGYTTARRFIITKIYKQMPINTCYEVDGKIFNTLKEADEYRKSL